MNGSMKYSDVYNKAKIYFLKKGKNMLADVEFEVIKTL